MQPPDVGMLFANGLMLMPKIVDEYGNTGFIFVQNPAKRFALTALVAIDWRVDANGLQLLGPWPGAVVEQIGEDDDIGMFAQPVEAFDRAVNRLLAVHFGIEKSVEQIPDPTAFNDCAIMLVAQRFTPVTMDKVEMDMVDTI